MFFLLQINAMSPPRQYSPEIDCALSSDDDEESSETEPSEDSSEEVDSNNADHEIGEIVVVCEV